MEISPEQFELFRKKMHSFHVVPGASFQSVAECLRVKKYNKGEVILREGEVCRGFWYIVSGCIRSFTLEDGHEINLSFYFDDQIASDFFSVRMEKPSQYFFIAMEDCETLYFSKADTAQLFFRDSNLTHLAVRFYQEKFFNEKFHSNSFKLMNPEERYQYLLGNQPHYLQRIPLTHLASYLGMSRETLTRIRKKIS
ncbi:MAG TPA: Crp/Fnr family transcriptional regulator [Panacibacter sp.]|nr:Crp/Fnr family transcriptional regulator [Panacibacter sp.]HNP46192.1 Crp/Fnr family transcriptional regulator [Panacibacter sp.]